jgi:hypothetical protein
MRQGRWLIAVLLIAVSPPAGCGRSAARTTTPKASKAVTRIPLPEWAPKNPSPEFLRAAALIRPYPQEFSVAREEGDLAARAFQERYDRTLVPAWEFFGMLSDEQINRLRSAKSLRLMVKDLSAKQRAGLYHYFDVWRKEMKGLPERPQEWGEDWLVELYKFGAKQDLSNVQIEFLAREGSHILVMILRAQKADGTLSPPCPAGLGLLG